ncbi:MAG: hypothetical protein WCA20_11095 [Candidatus Sulfotelmatobacter sp.]
MLHKFWAVTDSMMHQTQLAMFLKNLSMMGGALLIWQFGAGPWSFEARWKESPGSSRWGAREIRKGRDESRPANHS